MIHIVSTTKAVHKILMLLDIVTEMLLIAVVSWVLDLLTRSLPSWVWWLCVATLMLLFVGHVAAGSEILLPLLAVRIVILAFLFLLLPAFEARLPPL